MVLLSRTFVRMAIRLIEVQLVWGLVQHGTCVTVSLRSSIGRVAWIDVIRLRSLSEQLVPPELLPDLEE